MCYIWHLHSNWHWNEVFFFNWSIFDVLASQVAIVVQNSAYNGEELRDRVLIPGMGRSPGGVHGNPFQYSCLKNPMDTGTWQATIHRVSQSRNNWCDLVCLHIWCRILYVVCILSYFSFFLILWEPTDSSFCGIIWARILEWVAISSFKGSSQPWDGTHISFGSWISRWILCHWVTWEAPTILYVAGVQYSDSQFLKVISHLYLLWKLTAFPVLYNIRE